MKKKRSSWWIWLLVGIGGVVGFFFFILIVFAVLLGGGSAQGNVAHIQVNGVILVDGASSFSSDITSSRDIVEFIEQADEDHQIEAILIDINSPGGSAVASDEIAKALKKTQKPTVAVIRELGASGGYWIASSSDHIIANKMSITGSIGVISSYLEFSGLMKEYGVSYERLVAGDLKDSGTPFKKLTTAEQATLQRKLDIIHDIFIENVAANRDLSVQKVKEFATGEAFLGVEAFDLGLVDQLGDVSDAEEYLKEIAGLEEVILVSYKKEPSFFDILTGVVEEYSFSVGEGIGSALVRSPDQDLLIMAR